MDIIMTLYHAVFDLFLFLYQEIYGFLHMDGILELFAYAKKGEFSSLQTWDGLTSLLRQIWGLIFFLEVTALLIKRKFKIGEDYRMPFFISLFNSLVGRYISIGVIAYCIGLCSPYAIFKAESSWYIFIYGYIVWEFAYYVYHWSSHNVRILWCLHSVHHAPKTMNLSVSGVRFFLELTYLFAVNVTICILLGVPPVILAIIMTIDSIWGEMLHIGDDFLPNARFGFLGKLIITPSHHRVHHARNPLYLDTNYCVLLNIWDRLFGSYQPEVDNVNIEYGISREMNSDSFLDVYFGEILDLCKDIIYAPTLKDKLLYIIMPPGWSHTGDHKTASMERQKFLAAQQQEFREENFQTVVKTAPQMEKA